MNVALYMKQLVTETEIDLSVRDGRDKKRNKHHNSIYKKDRFVFYVNVVNKSICIAPVGALMG